VTFLLENTGSFHDHFFDVAVKLGKKTSADIVSELSGENVRNSKIAFHGSVFKSALNL